MSFLLLSAMLASVTCFDLEAYFTNWTISAGAGANRVVADEQTPRNLTLPDDATRKETTANPELKLTSNFSIPVLNTSAPSIGVFMRVTLDEWSRTNFIGQTRTLVTLKGEPEKDEKNVAVTVGVRFPLSWAVTGNLECVISFDGKESSSLDCKDETKWTTADPQRLALAILFYQHGLVEVRIDGKTLSMPKDGGAFSSARSVLIAANKDSALVLDDLAVFVFGANENINSQLQDLTNGRKPPTSAAVSMTLPRGTSTLTPTSTTDQPSSSPKATPGSQTSTLSPSSTSVLVETSSGTNGVESSPSDTATIIGAAAGSVAFLCLAAAIVGVVLYFRKKKTNAASPSAPSGEMAMTRPVVSAASGHHNYGAPAPIREHGGVTPEQNYGAPKLHNDYDAGPLDI
jgi:hypothetical protein